MTEKLLSFQESWEEQKEIYLIWILGITLSTLVFYSIGGFQSLFSIISYLVLLGILTVNMFLSARDRISDYKTELDLYSYVEKNARSFLPFAIAMAALIIAGTRVGIEIPKGFAKLLTLTTICFVGILTIIWMPKESGKHIRHLRDVKTILLTLGSVSVIGLVYSYMSFAEIKTSAKA